jgi:hypothetical protein
MMTRSFRQSPISPEADHGAAPQPGLGVGDLAHDDKELSAVAALLVAGSLIEKPFNALTAGFCLELGHAWSPNQETKTPQRVSQIGSALPPGGINALTPQDASFLVFRPEINRCG